MPINPAPEPDPPVHEEETPTYSRIEAYNMDPSQLDRDLEANWKAGYEAAKAESDEEEGWISQQDKVQDQALRIAALQAVTTKIPSSPVSALNDCQKVFQWLKTGTLN